ncbi:MAG: hypothetical protein IMF11_05015 [Proteobacteria bacterium]|nr:hypothetical protein [Pseudomonadota bacterium]
MDEEKREKGQKEMPGDDSISRRKFFKKMAYAAPVVMTFIASKAYAQQITPCQPSQCRPACQPVPCRPHKPCLPTKPCPPRP